MKKQEWETDQLKEPVISIITPYYNGEKYIDETAKSILNQTFPFWEWVIVDDASTTKEAQAKLQEIEQLDKRIHVFHKENGGPAVARDYGVKQANQTSEFLCFLDADDLICNTYLECAYITLKTNPKASWTYTDTINFDGREFLWRKWYSPTKEMEENLLVMTSLVRRKDFVEAGGFAIQEKTVYEDWCLWLKLIQLQKYPVHMTFLGTWYRQKAPEESELARTNVHNKTKALAYKDQIVQQIHEAKEAVQFPKADFNWDRIPDDLPQDVLMPKRKKDEKIKILMFFPWMVVGGADKFNLDLIKGLDPGKYEVTIVTTEPSNNPWRLQFEQYASVYELPAFLEQKYWLAFVSYLIQKNQINLIFNSNSKFGYAVLPYLKARYPEIPMLDYVHMEEWYNRNGGFSRDSSAIAEVLDKTYVCNQNSEKILVHHFERKPQEVETVYIGVDEKKFDPAKYDKTKILEELQIQPNGKKIIGYICRITEQKRPHLLLQIAKELKKKRDDFLVVVAGDGALLPAIREEAKRFHLEDNMVFLGNIKQTEKIYAICDMTLNCSIKEGLALTAYESLAMGVPVISSDVGGQKELITQEVGIIVPCLQKEKDIYDIVYSEKEVQPYVKGILHIMDHLDQYKKQCRNKILNGFTIDQMIQKMNRILQETAEHPNAEKIENGKRLEPMQNLLKELVVKNFATFQGEYEWSSNQFLKENLWDMKKPMSWYIKHPIVVVLQKLGVYEFCKKLIEKK